MSLKDRRAKHLRRGENVFIPQWRIRQIRWEESVLQSRLRRLPKIGRLIHHTCHCGSISCVGVPIYM